MPIPGSTKPTAESNATRLLAMAKASPLPATAVTQHAKQTAATNTPSIVDLSPEQIGWDQWDVVEIAKKQSAVTGAMRDAGCDRRKTQRRNGCQRCRDARACECKPPFVYDDPPGEQARLGQNMPRPRVPHRADLPPI
jgi:hypothetical protein